MTAHTALPESTCVLLFLHVPKASGTTLGFIIERQYPAGAVYHTADMAPRAIAQALRRDRRPDELQCVMGHMLFGLHQYLERPAVYITMLRHPMRRLISHYAFVRRTPEHPLHAHVIDQRLTFEDYVASGLTTELNDGGVRLLCGREDAETVGYGRVTRAMLEDAKANLRKHFLAVGITERFQESVLLFQQLLHWKRVEEYRSLNRSERRETSLPLTDQARSLIARYNALDLELYEYARQLLQDSLAIHGIDRTALVRFRARIIAHRLRLRAHIIKYRVAHRIRTTIARAGGR